MSADLYFGNLPFKEDAATIKDASSVDPTDSIVIKLASFRHGKLGTLYPPPYSHVLACPVLPFLLSIPILSKGIALCAFCADQRLALQNALSQPQSGTSTMVAMRST